MTKKPIIILLLKGLIELNESFIEEIKDLDSNYLNDLDIEFLKSFFNDSDSIIEGIKNIIHNEKRE